MIVIKKALYVLVLLPTLIVATVKNDLALLANQLTVLQFAVPAGATEVKGAAEQKGAADAHSEQLDRIAAASEAAIAKKSAATMVVALEACTTPGEFLAWKHTFFDPNLQKLAASFEEYEQEPVPVNLKSIHRWHTIVHELCRAVEAKRIGGQAASTIEDEGLSVAELVQFPPISFFKVTAPFQKANYEQIAQLAPLLVTSWPANKQVAWNRIQELASDFMHEGRASKVLRAIRKQDIEQYIALFSAEDRTNLLVMDTLNFVNNVLFPKMVAVREVKYMRGG